MSCRIAAFDGGTYYHMKALNEPAWADLIDEQLYLPDLDDADFSDFDVLIATCRSNPELIQPHRDRIASFLEGGGTMVAFAGTAPERWLPGVAARPVPTNYWWWLDRDADSGLRIVTPEHSLFTAVTLADCTWHHHCRFIPPAGAVSLIDHADGGSVLYEDSVSSNGRLLVTGLDPFFHHGSHFMPAASRFLKGFLPWLHDTADNRPRELHT